MLPRGRPPGPGSAEEKAAIRREKVRLNVKAYRERKKKQALADSSTTPPSSTSSRHPSLSHQVSNAEDEEEVDATYRTPEYEELKEDKSEQVVLQSTTQMALQTYHTNRQRMTAQSSNGWLSPDSGPMFSLALLSVFRKNFLPSQVVLPSKYGTRSELITPCSPWIMNAYNMALQQDTGALRSGLVAIGLVLNGLENSSSDMKVASIQMHRRALCRLHSDLGPIALRRNRNISVTNIITPYLSCLAVAMFEMIQSGFSPVILQHVKALNSMIELMYADPSVDMRTANLIMEDFGMLEMLFCLKYGFPSLLRETRRKLGLRREGDNASDTGSRKNASVYGDMIDIVEELPLLMARTKSFKDRVDLDVSPKKVQQTINRLLQIQDSLETWNNDFELEHGSIMFQDSFAGGNAQLRSYEHGAVGLFLLNFQLTTIDVAIDAVTVLARGKGYRDQIKSIPIRQPSIDQTAENMLNKGRHADLWGITDESRSPSGSPRGDTPFEQLRSLRIQERFVITQLIELVRQFSKIAVNISGRSFLVSPCDKITEVLDKEQARLEEDLQQLQPEHYDRMTEIEINLSDLALARAIFKEVEASALQHNFGTV